MKEKAFMAEHNSGERRWCIEETETGFLSPTSQYRGSVLLEIGAPPMWHLRKPQWSRVSPGLNKVDNTIDNSRYMQCLCQWRFDLHGIPRNVENSENCPVHRHST